MSMNPIIQLADAVATDLNEQTWEPSFEATRSYRPTFDLEDLETLRVTVAPAAMEMMPLSRGEYERRLGVLVVVQARMGLEQMDRLDELANLIHEIGEHLTDLELADMPDARFTGIENDPLYHPDILETKRVFLAPMLATYRLLD